MERLEVLKELKEIIYYELELDEELLLLSRRDSRLGYHPEAEGYKYYPAKIRWRMEQLRKVLSTDLPEIEQQIRDGKLLFPEYTGEKPTGLIAKTIPTKKDAWTSRGEPASNLSWQSFNNGDNKKLLQWASGYDKDGLYIIIRGVEKKADISSLVSNVTIRLQPRRLWPSKRFNFNTDVSEANKTIRMIKSKGSSLAIVKISWNDMGADRDPDRMRIDVQVTSKNNDVAGWCDLKPVTSRLEHGTDNPNDLGWLMIEK